MDLDGRPNGSVCQTDLHGLLCILIVREMFIRRPQSNSNWQQRQNRTWAPVNNTRSASLQNLNRQQMNRSRGEIRAQNFQRIPSSPSSGGYRPSGGGGGRRTSLPAVVVGDHIQVVAVVQEVGAADIN